MQTSQLDFCNWIDWDWGGAGWGGGGREVEWDGLLRTWRICKILIASQVSIQELMEQEKMETQSVRSNARREKERKRGERCLRYLILCGWENLRDRPRISNGISGNTLVCRDPHNTSTNGSEGRKSFGKIKTKQIWKDFDSSETVSMKVSLKTLFETSFKSLLKTW